MKKFLVAILTILYVTSTSGATVHFHYCMGQLVDAGFTTNKKGKCPKCGMDKQTSKKACCQDVHKFVKVEKAHEKGSFQMPVFFAAPEFIEHTVSYSFFVQPAVIGTAPTHGPPLITSASPLFIQHCHFRI